MSQLRELLATNSVFNHLSAQDQEVLAQQAIYKKFGRGEWVAPQGDTWPYLLIVSSGMIHALKASREGRSLIVLTLGPGDMFWGMDFFHDAALMPVLLQAQHPSEIYLWSREQMLPWLWENGRVSWELARLMVQRMLRASQIVEELAFQPVRGRLARLLLERYEDAVDDFVARDLTLDELAAFVGTKREMVCRLLYEFAEEGAIEISRTEFMITNRGKLKGYAQSAKG